MTQNLYAGIDAGGTEFKCIVGTSPDHIVAEKAIKVGQPELTMGECVKFFEAAQQQWGEFSSFGIACFGPVDLNLDSPTYGFITSTPKPHWQRTDIVGYFRDALQLPIALETDVNGALLAEQCWGNAVGLHSAVYVTVGTGIGAGVCIDGKLLHGAMHAEAGHMLIPRHSDDSFQGVCPFHGDCLEGLASGPALAARWQKNPRELESDHPAWSLQAHYLASMCVNLALMYSPQRIILGGGVMQQSELIALVRKSYLAQINRYLGDSESSVEAFISEAGLGIKSGALGAIALAAQVAQN